MSWFDQKVTITRPLHRQLSADSPSPLIDGCGFGLGSIAKKTYFLVDVMYRFYVGGYEVGGERMESMTAKAWKLNGKWVGIENHSLYFVGEDWWGSTWGYGGPLVYERMFRGGFMKYKIGGL